jgi:hypothetical protein
MAGFFIDVSVSCEQEFGCGKARTLLQKSRHKKTPPDRDQAESTTACHLPRSNQRIEAFRALPLNIGSAEAL